MKRFVALVLTGAMAVSLAACSNNAGSGSTATPTPANSSSQPAASAPAPAGGESDKSLPVLSASDPTNFTIFLPTTKEMPSADNKIVKKLKDDLGVTLELNVVTSNFEEKIGVMIAASDYPDIIGNSSLNARFIEAGALMPLNDYLTPDLAGNILTHVEPVWNRVSYTGDGLIYVLPNYNRFYGEIGGGTHWGPAFWIQKAVLAEFGYPEVTNLDQYFDLIEQYKEKYPKIDGQDTIGFEILAAPNKEFCLQNAPQHLIGHPNDGGVVVDFETSVAEIYADKDYAKDYFKKLNEMNAKGIVDRETFTQNFDQYISKLASGRVLGMFDQRWNFGTAWDTLEADGKNERQWAPVMPVYDGYEPYYRDRDVMNINQGLGVGKDSKVAEKAISFLNTLLEEDWQKLFGWGVEGEDFLVDENGRYYRTQEMRDLASDAIWKATNKFNVFWDLAPKHEGQYSDGNSDQPDRQPEEFYDGLKDYDKQFMEAYGRKSWVQFLNDPPENPAYYPAWSIPLEDGSDAQLANVELTDLAVQYLPKAILADPAQFDSIWDDYSAAVQKSNYKDYEDTINKEIQWRVENWGN